MPADQVLFYNGRGILGLYVAVPDGFGINHNHGPMLALVQATGLVDADLARQAGSLGKLLQLRVQIALSILGAGGPRRIGGTGVTADKNVVFKRWQAEFLLDADTSRL